jgi:hypothetical protein
MKMLPRGFDSPERFTCSMWRFRGTPFYLDAQADRLGISRILADRARTNAEIHRVSTLLGQLCERYHHAPKQDGRIATVFPAELAQIQGTLGQAECELAKLHALAAAATAMIDEAHQAFGLALPQRTHRVVCDFDESPTMADLRPIKLHPESPRASKAKVS